MPLLRRHRLWQIAVDAALIAGAWYLAFALRFDKGVPPLYDHYWRRTILIVVGVKLGILLLSGWYVKWWRYISLRDVQVLARSVVFASVVLWVAFAILPPVGDKRLPLGVAVLDLLLTLMGLAGVRVVARSLIERPRPGALVPGGKEVLVVGAGDAGGLVLREMRTTRLAGYTPIGLVDDDPRKRHMRLHGVKVLGTTDDLPRLLRERRPDEVHIAIPSAAGATRNRIVAACRTARVPVRTLPAVHDLVDGDSNLLRQMREVRVEDVLGRDPVQLDPDEIGGYVRDRVVLVTGAGGSIGSELCRQLARMSPTRLVLLDHAETNLFQIERELLERGVTNIVPVIGDVKDAGKLDRLFLGYRPEVVFHAAAYKHVPLMQANPLEAIRNNAIATRTLARVAAKHGTSRFVLISTDKAVNAQTVMGATKALCEWIVEGIAEDRSPMVAVAVRFGNVLASSGSVVPIFRRQIAAGGPVTVTDPAHDQVLHDDPGGRAARRPGRRSSAGRRDLRARHGRAGADPRPGARHDPPVGTRARSRHRDRDRRRPAWREARRGPLRGMGDRAADGAREGAARYPPDDRRRVARRPDRRPRAALDAGRHARRRGAAAADGAGAAPRRLRDTGRAARRAGTDALVDTRQLAAFVAVVERGSFSIAADDLGVTQPAVSLAVRSLEKRLGARLLDRSGRQVAPTAAGRAVLIRAQRMLALEQELSETLRAEADTLGGHLTVGASTGPGARLLPRLLVGFRRIHPEATAALRIDATQDVIDRVLAREIELGVVGAERPHRSLEYEPFAADEIVLAVPAGHSFAGRDDVTIDELRTVPMVVQQEGSGVRALTERELRHHGVRLRDLDIVAELGLQESAVTAVAEGLGVTFTSHDSIRNEIALGYVEEARVKGLELRRDYVLVRPASREPSRLAEAFLAFCREELAPVRE